MNVEDSNKKQMKNYVVSLVSTDLPVKTQDEFDKFTDNLELNLDLAVQNNLYLEAVLSDFKAKSKNWYGFDKNNFE